MVTDAKTWRQAREVGTEVQFAVSGFTASIRPVEADFFLLQDEGGIPNAIMQSVLEIMDLKPRKLPEAEKVEKDKDWISFLNRLCVYTFVSPVCKGHGEPLGDGEISVDDIPYGDKVLLYRLFATPARVLTGFRQEQQKRTLATLGTEPTVSQAPQSTDENKQLGSQEDGSTGLVDKLAV